MKKFTFALVAVVFIVLPSAAQIFIVRDDSWAAISSDSRALISEQVEIVEWWLRRLRMPYQRINASALTRIEDNLFVLPANRPDASILTKLRNARRAVIFAFVGDQASPWREALNITDSKEVVRQNGWVVVFQPFPPDLPNGERAKLLASWLLEGTKIPAGLQRALQARWWEWYQSLKEKRRRWLLEIGLRPYRDLGRKEEALHLLRQPIEEISFSLTQNGSVWLKRLWELLREHERIHKALAISLESRESEIRGIWLHTYAPTDWEDVLGTIKSANLNCLFFRAGRGGNVVYRSQFLPRDPWAEQADLDELKNATEAAHRYGIELHAWRVNYHFGTAPDWLKKQMAEKGRLVVDPQGKQALWLNPGDPRNQEHELRAMMELLNYPVAGIHFDYIRYPEVPHYYFDYSEISRQEFERATGIKLTDFPKQVLFGPLRIRYDDWQRDNITNLVKKVYDAVKGIHPDVAVSAAVWQRHRYYYALIKQDWMKWVREKILDFVCPMDYTNDNDAFRERVYEQVLEINGQVPIAIGIGAYLHADEWQFVEQVKIARDLGADGFVIFSYNIAPIKDFLKVLTLGATSQPTQPAHRVPQITFRLSNGIRLKDSPIIYRAGDRIRFTVAVAKGMLQGELKELHLTLLWERHEGFAERVIAEVAFDGDVVERGSIVSGEAIIPEGTVRMFARGHVIFSNGSIQTFVRRGPFVKGVKGTEFHKLVQSLLPYKPPKGACHPIVGVIAEGWGSERFVEILKSAGVHAFLVRFLEPAYWEVADILLFPPLRDVRELTYQRAEALRDWVARGGKIILLSEACGYKAHANLFPEIAIVTGERPVETVSAGKTQIAIETRALTLKPRASEPIGRAGKDVIVAKGGFNKGVVVYCGVRVPTSDDAPEWVGWRKLLPALLKF